MKKQVFLPILFVVTTLIVAYKQAPPNELYVEVKGYNTILPVAAYLVDQNYNSKNTENFADSLSAWEAFKKTAYTKLDANAKVIIRLKVSIPQGSDNSKREYLKKIGDFERRNDNLRNNLQVIKELANESLVIFKNNFNYENTALINEMNLIAKNRSKYSLKT